MYVEHLKITKGLEMNFIVIDDSKVDCFIAEKVIQDSGWCTDCHTFQLASDALEHIRKKKSPEESTIIFVDEHMPLMNGLDFVKAFDELDIDAKDSYHIFLLSSSIYGASAPQDHQLIRKFIKKPLMTKTIHELFQSDLKFLTQ